MSKSKLMITTAKIKALDPCKDRLDNWKNKYPKWKGTLSEFLDLPNITFQDKTWVYFRMIDKTLVSKVAATFAREVLYIYESAYPNDDRPRKAIEAAERGDANAAVNAAANAANAAYAAAYAANAAYAAYAAVNAAVNAAANVAYAVNAAYAAARAGTKEDRLIMIMKEFL